MHQEVVIMSIKRRGKEQSEEMYAQSKKLHQCGSQSKQPQSASISEENELNHGIPTDMPTRCNKCVEDKK